MVTVEQAQAMGLPEIKPENIHKIEIKNKDGDSPVCIIIAVDGGENGVMMKYELDLMEIQKREIENKNIRQQFAEYFEAAGCRMVDWAAVHRASKKVRHDKRTKHREHGGQKKKRNKTLKYLRKQALKELTQNELQITEQLKMPEVVGSPVARILKEELADIRKEMESLTQALS